MALLVYLWTFQSVSLLIILITLITTTLITNYFKNFKIFKIKSFNLMKIKIILKK